MSERKRRINLKRKSSSTEEGRGKKGDELNAGQELVVVEMADTALERASKWSGGGSK